MSKIEACELPAAALLRKYVDGVSYTDCYRIRVARFVSHADYLEAFYTTPLFRVERWILAALVASPSSDEQVRQLAAGETDTFAAWSVEARAENQLLLCDLNHRTRSWLMTEAADDPDATWLYFGSAVVPRIDPHSARPSLGAIYSALLGFHKLYSRALLHSCVARLRGRSRN
jgi:hypothetical protein